MTEKEFLALNAGKPVVLKYVGKNRGILSQLTPYARKNGISISYIQDGRKSSWYRKEGLTFTTWNGKKFVLIKPKDWIRYTTGELRREKIKAKATTARKKKMTQRLIDIANEDVPAELDTLFENVYDVLQDVKYRIDVLDQIPFEHKFKLLSKLTLKQKRALQFIEMEREDFEKILMKVVK